ncbi:MAG: AgmX/PglI C-terminal domain-containing protein, partial [Myxococcota bacterium]
IRRVIKRHIAQIRYCYERELQVTPGLFGKVSTLFVISAEGGVNQAKVEQTTLKNEKVERCVLSKIRTWKFPKPRGGGIVVVKYPFIFKTSG